MQVSFQQSTVAPADDLHVLGRRDGEEEPSLETWIAVRRRVRFTLGDERTGAGAKSQTPRSAFSR